MYKTVIVLRDGRGDLSLPNMGASSRKPAALGIPTEKPNRDNVR